MRIVGFAGSLRIGSYNKQLLAAVGDSFGPDVQFETLDLSKLPLYNADEERGDDSTPAGRLRAAVRSADGLVIVTPEYNQGLPGVTKNAVDWLSRGPRPRVLEGKPVAIAGATPGKYGTRRAQADLRHILAVVGAVVMVRPWLLVRDAGNRLGDGGGPDNELTAAIADYSAAFVDWVRRLG